MRKVFLAGATGFTGKAILAQEADLAFVLGLRQRSPQFEQWKDDPRHVVVDYKDPASVEAALSGCEAVLTAIGTTMGQFRPGVNYKTVDYGTTVALLAAAEKAGVKHFVLMSSFGAGMPGSPYLAWKRRAEKAVDASPVPHTIVRPSFLMGEGRSFPRPISLLIDLMAKISPLYGPMTDVRAIPIDVLAWNFCRILEAGEPTGGILSGRDLWEAWYDR